MEECIARRRQELRKDFVTEAYQPHANDYEVIDEEEKNTIFHLSNGWLIQFQVSSRPSIGPIYPALPCRSPHLASVWPSVA